MLNMLLTLVRLEISHEVSEHLPGGNWVTSRILQVLLILQKV